MKQKNSAYSEKVPYIAWRFYLVLSFVMIASLGLIARVLDLAIFDSRFLRQEGDERVLRLINTPAFRGLILDRNGYPLAVSTKVFSIWVNPKEFSPTDETLEALSHLLHIKSSEIQKITALQNNTTRAFVYLKRAISPDLTQEIKSLQIPGVYVQQASHRYYPEGEVFAHVIGFTDIDDHGQEGLELAYNQWLQGESGKKWVMKDRLGQIVSDVQTITEQTPGHDLTLSLDRRIQYLAYRALLAGVTHNRARSGSAIVIDAKTGEILAMVNQPSFNPNQRPSRICENYRNRAVTDTFEPGSTIKAFSIASALDSGLYQPDSLIDTAPGWIKLDKNLVTDDGKNYGLISVSRILQVSSNVGVSKMVLTLPPNHFWNLLRRVGFGEITGVGFPGEQNGSLMDPYHMGAFTLATLAFGYGISVTALQLAYAYTILANDGLKIPLSLLRVDKPPIGKQVIEATIAKNMLLLLESVVAKGTGESAYVPGYRIAGKTGTSRMVGERGYQRNHHESSFVGIAPVSNPRLVVAVVVHDPQGKNYAAGLVAGPIFERIMEDTLRILAIPPDVSS